MGRAVASATVFHAIADPTRRRVLESLRRGERTVGELQDETGAGQSALSQHLAVLRRARLVDQQRDGRHRRYRLRRPTPLREVFDWIEFFEGFWDSRLDALGDYLRRHG